MEVRNLSDAFKLIMEERGWTQTDLAGELGKSQPWLSKVINGTRGMSVGKVSVLFDQVGWELVIRPKRGRREEPVKRREFHERITKIAGVAMADKVAGVVFIPSERVSPYQDPEYLRGLAVHLAQTHDQIGGVPLVSVARRHAAQIKSTVNSRDGQLQMAASDLARKASLILYEAQQVKEANNVGIFALTLARRAGYGEGIAHCHENLCLFNAETDPLQAAHYAKTGLKYPQLTSEHRARLNARFGAAITRKASRDRRAVEVASRSALDEARSISELSTRAGVVVLGSAGNVLARLKRYDEADAAFDEAIRRLADSPMLRANWMWQQITASLNGAQLFRAADQMHDLARVVPLVSSALLNKKVLEIMTLSGQWVSVPEIRAARDQLRDVMPRGGMQA